MLATHTPAVCRLVAAPLLMLLGSCSTPPQPPNVNDATRRPANTALAIELQDCKSDLANTRIRATEAAGLAEQTAVVLHRLASQPPTTNALPAASTLTNSLYTIHFDFASSKILTPPDGTARLIEEAKTAPLVMLRGRTDGTADSLGEARIARQRAAVVRDYLVSAGVDPARIRATFQPSGDPVADNSDDGGRALNRRVEIEVYRALPVAVVQAGTANR